MSEGDKDIEIESRKKGFTVWPLRLRRGFDKQGPKKILQLCKSSGGSIIHCHGYKGNILLGLMPRSQRNIPVITTLHGWTALRLFSKMGLYQLLDAYAIRRLETVVAVSSKILYHPLIKLFGINPVVISNGIRELEFLRTDFETVFPEVAQRCSSGFNIISIGRLSPEKGFDILIHALGLLTKRVGTVNLIIIGEGKEKGQLQELARRMGFGDRVFFLGYQHEASRFIPFFDAFVISSHTEGLPITLLEAMQSGTPIIATRVGEIPHVLEDGRCGELTHPGRIDGLAIALEQVCRDKCRAQKKAVRARQRVSEEYGVDRMADAYLKQYSMLVSRFSIRGNQMMD